MLELIQDQTRQAVCQLLETARLKPGQILAVGCSSSEVGNFQIGSHSSVEIGQAIFETLQEVLKPKGIYLAAQCCEHLNRAIIIEEEAAEKYGYEPVNAVPRLKAGGSFATAAYGGFSHPVAVEQVRAHAGMDIGDTLIGMHLKEVAVPVRIEIKEIGGAHLVCARTRPKYIGGQRACYDETLG
ncbi:MAG: TIGR01440 family protein [Lachnospiraceae bacterium]